MLTCLVLSISGVGSPEGDWSRRWSDFGGREAFRALVAQLAVRPVMVVVEPIVFNDHASLREHPGMLPVEAKKKRRFRRRIPNFASASLAPARLALWAA